MNKKIIAPLIGAGVVLLAALIAFASFNNVQREAVDRETALTAQYLANQNELSTYITSFYEQTGVAEVKAQKLNAILLDAVKGRYDGRTSAQPGQGQLFSAMVEAYPDLGALDVYDRILSYVASGREAYKNKQDKLLDMLRAYDHWRKAGLVHRQMVEMIGVPTESLRAGSLKGERAEKEMYSIVLAKQAKDAYETRLIEPLRITNGDQS